MPSQQCCHTSQLCIFTLYRDWYRLFDIAYAASNQLSSNCFKITNNHTSFQQVLLPARALCQGGGSTCEKNMPEPPEKKLMVSLNSRSHSQPIPNGSDSSYCARYVCSSGRLSQESSSADAQGLEGALTGVVCSHTW